MSYWRAHFKNKRTKKCWKTGSYGCNNQSPRRNNLVQSPLVPGGIRSDQSLTSYQYQRLLSTLYTGFSVPWGFISFFAKKILAPDKKKQVLVSNRRVPAFIKHNFL